MPTQVEPVGLTISREKIRTILITGGGMDGWMVSEV